MPQSAAEPGTKPPESTLHEVEGVQVFARKDADGRPSKVDAIDQDEQKIRRIADRLQRRGYGVMRMRNPRAGKTFYIVKGLWVGPGEPPEDPFGDN